MAKYLKTTDKSNKKAGVQVGYHDVDDDFELPIDVNGNTTYEFVAEAEARENHPALFGEVVEVVAPEKNAKKVEEGKE